MARINIEDSLFKDDRWYNLIAKTGCRHKALGILANAWILAQKNWLNHKSIPLKSWPKDLNVLIEVEFAEEIETGIYVKGSKNAFKWLEQRATAGKQGGLKSGQNRKKSAEDKQKTEATAKRDEALASFREASSLPPTPSLDLFNTNAQETKRPLQSAKNAQAFGLSELDAELESIYSEYPRKVGKSDAFKRLKKSVKSKADLDDLRTAVRRFGAYCVRKNTKKEYIPYFSTFATSWRDYLEADFDDNSGKNSIDFSGVTE